MIIDTGARHLRLAARTLLRNKAAYLFAVAILALGIGMSVAMFSLVDAVLLRPLPFPKQESIEVIWKVDPLAGSHVEELAYPELGDLQQSIPDFDSVAVMPTSLYGYARVLQNGKNEPVQIESSPVSHDFFRVLGVAPRLGRDFTSSDERVGAPPVAVISDRVWRNQLGADPNIVGRVIRLNGQGTIVIGVMAAGVEFPLGAGLWIPLGVERDIVDSRGATFLQAIARTKPGISRERILVQVNALFSRLAADHPEAYTRSQRGVVRPLVEYWTGSARLHLWIMLGASLLLLLASIISAGNLLLSRTLIAAARNRYSPGLGSAARPDPRAAWLGRRAGVDGCGGGRAGRGRDRYPISGPLGARGHSAIAGSGIGCRQLLLRRYGRDVGCAGMHAHPRMGRDTHACGVRSARGRRAIIVVPARGQNQEHIHSGAGGVTVTLLVLASLLVLSYRSMMSADIGFRNRDTVSMNLQLRGPGMFSAPGLRCEIPAQILLATVGPVA